MHASRDVICGSDVMTTDFAPNRLSQLGLRSLSCQRLVPGRRSRRSTSQVFSRFHLQIAFISLYGSNTKDKQAVASGSHCSIPYQAECLRKSPIYYILHVFMSIEYEEVPNFESYSATGKVWMCANTFQCFVAKSDNYICFQASCLIRNRHFTSHVFTQSLKTN